MKTFLGLILACLGAANGYAGLKVAPVFGDHMVLQREMPVPVWGTATPESDITVTFADQTKAARVGQDGQWQVRLDPMTASDNGRQMVVQSSVDKVPVAFSDVLVGEVWLGSGQSNMDIVIKDWVRWKKSDAAFDALRDGRYPLVRQYQARAEARTPTGWAVATPEAIPEFSTLLLPFGLALQKELGVPVGLILCALGGSPSGRWVTEAMSLAEPLCAADLEAYEKGFPAALAEYEKRLAAWKAARAAGRDPGKAPARPLAPGVLRGGQVKGDLYEAHLRPLVPYAIRGLLWDQGESGTGVGGIEQVAMMKALLRGWRGAWGQPLESGFPMLYMQKPSGGVSAYRPDDPVTALADTCTAQPETPADALLPNGLRFPSVDIMSLPNAALITAMDLGGETHPRNKAGYGQRAARVALGHVYGRAGEFLGPCYASHQAEGGALRVRFKHVGSGLAYANAERLQGFALAGKDKVFHWASAQIEGDTVVLSSPRVPEPLHARYAWSWDIRYCNLFNKDGLPALPFMTDRVPCATAKK